MLLCSSISLTSDLKNIEKDLSSMYVIDRLMRPIIQFALQTVRSECCLKVNSLSMVQQSRFLGLQHLTLHYCHQNLSYNNQMSVFFEISAILNTVNFRVDFCVISKTILNNWQKILYISEKQNLTKDAPLGHSK